MNGKSGPPYEKDEPSLILRTCSAISKSLSTNSSHENLQKHKYSYCYTLTIFLVVGLAHCARNKRIQPTFPFCDCVGMRRRLAPAFPTIIEVPYVFFWFVRFFYHFTLDMTYWKNIFVLTFEMFFLSWSNISFVLHFRCCCVALRRWR